MDAGQRRVWTFALGMAALGAAVSTGVLLLLPTSTSIAPEGVSVAGRVSVGGLAIARLVFDVALGGVAGCLLVAGWLLGPTGSQAAAHHLLRCARRWAALWLVSGAVVATATLAEVTGVPVTRLEFAGSDLRVLMSLPQGRGIIVAAGGAITVAAFAGRVRRSEAAFTLLVIAMLATGPLLLTGHAATSSSHYLAGQSLIVHVLAASVWFGGLFVLATHLRKHRSVISALAPRFSQLALVCFLLVAASGIFGAWLRLGLDPSTWTSRYGALLAAKTGALLLVGLAGVAHRSWTLRLLEAGRDHAFLRLALGEIAVMTAALAMGVALSRTAPPPGARAGAALPHAARFPTVDPDLPPVGLRGLLFEVHPDPLVITGVAAATALSVAVYLRLRRTPDGWPPGRLIGFVLGLLLLWWAFGGGLGAYSAALLSAQLGQLLTLAVIVPALLVACAPPRLAGLFARSAPTRQVDGLLAFVFLFVAVGATPLLENTLGSPLGHGLLGLAALLCGIALFVPLLSEFRPGNDPGVVLGLLTVVLLAQAIQLWQSRGLVAGDWFTRLDWSWSDAEADQRAAAVVVGCFALGLLGASLATLVRARR